MEISIKYCVDWNYLPQAAGLADAVKKKFGLDSKLIKGGGGIFDVAFDNKVYYSKKSNGGRFPTHEEIIEMI